MDRLGRTEGARRVRKARRARKGRGTALPAGRGFPEKGKGARCATRGSHPPLSLLGHRGSLERKGKQDAQPGPGTSSPTSCCFSYYSPSPSSSPPPPIIGPKWGKGLMGLILVRASKLHWHPSARGLGIRRVMGWVGLSGPWGLGQRTAQKRCQTECGSERLLAHGASRGSGGCMTGGSHASEGSESLGPHRGHRVCETAHDFFMYVSRSVWLAR